MFRKFIFFLACILAGCCDKESLGPAKQKLYSSVAREKTQAAQALAKCPVYAESAVPRLIELLYDENVGVQSAAAYALRKIDTPAARKALAK